MYLYCVSNISLCVWFDAALFFSRSFFILSLPYVGMTARYCVDISTELDMAVSGAKVIVATGDIGPLNH